MWRGCEGEERFPALQSRPRPRPSAFGMKSWILARFWHLAEVCGFQRRLVCPHCHELFPMWGPTGLFVHLYGGGW